MRALVACNAWLLFEKSELDRGKTLKDLEGCGQTDDAAADDKKGVQWKKEWGWLGKAGWPRGQVLELQEAILNLFFARTEEKLGLVHQTEFVMGLNPADNLFENQARRGSFSLPGRGLRR